MSIRSKGWGAVAFCMILAGSEAQAATVRFSSDSYGTTGGGEFVFELTSGSIGAYPRSGPLVGPNTGSLNALETAPTGSAGAKFTTFCLEIDEFIGPAGHTYRAETNDIVYGGGKNTNAGDLLDGATKFLYAAFATGSLSDAILGTNAYRYTQDNAGNPLNTANTLRTSAANDLQNAIWALEEERDDNLSGRALFYRNLGIYASGLLGLGANDNGDAAEVSFNGSSYNSWLTGLILPKVTAMNVYGYNSRTGQYDIESQSQLILDTPPTVTVVPLPASVWAGGALCGLLLLRGKFAKQNATA